MARELAALTAVRDREVPAASALTAHCVELQTVNARLWEIEDKLRECERDCRFDAEFIELARDVYRNNDRRAALKREINALTGSELVEEKSYLGV